MSNPAQNEIEFDYSKYGFRDEENYTFKSSKGLNADIVRTISEMKGEPEWMLQRRLKALEIFHKKPLPVSGVWANPRLAELDFQDIHYYVRPGERAENNWDDVPESIKNTFENWVFLKPNASSWLALALNTNQKLFTTRCAKSGKNWA